MRNSPDSYGTTHTDLADEYFDRYCVARQKADQDRRSAGHSAEVLDMIRSDMAKWICAIPSTEIEKTAECSRSRINTKLLGLVDELRRSYSEFVSPAELEATELFVEATFALHASDAPFATKAAAGEVPATFVFLVHTRSSVDAPEYDDEVVPAVPALHYLPGHLRPMMMMGVPPYIVDTYSAGELTGYLIVSPIFAEMSVGVSRSDFIRLSRLRIQETVDFAARLNAQLIGLGGVLPSLTRYGQTIRAGDAVVTTGHAGTIALVVQNVERAVDQIGPESMSTIGVLGLGSIGRSIALTLVDRFGDRYSILVYDQDQASTTQFENSLSVEPGRSVEAAANVADLIGRSDVVVSAVTSRIDFDRDLAHECSRGDVLTGKVLIDDSQPFSFDPLRTEELGGQLTWVVAHTGSQIRRTWYDYTTMANRHHDFFGCEAEVASLAVEYGNHLANGSTPHAALEQVRELSVRHAASDDEVAVIAQLFARHGISVAAPQTFGAAGVSEPIIDMRSPAETETETETGTEFATEPAGHRG